MKTEGQIESKYMANETRKERGLIKEEDMEFVRGYQKALEWVLSSDE